MLNCSAAELTAQLKQQARELGFHLTGVCPAVSPSGFHKLLDWIDQGYAGQMRYLEQRKDAYRHPSGVMPGVKSLLMLGLPYRTEEPRESALGSGRISRYAWGSVDYHDVIHQKLKQLKRWLMNEVPEANVRGVVDTAPLLERDFAQLAGLGWIGKNTLLINKHQGSYFFLSALLLDLELIYDAPHEASHCGTCQRCLDACPTDAFLGPGTLDARRCISYLTIEHRDSIDLELREPMGDWLFGCDICQDVCPWNRRGSVATDDRFKLQPRTQSHDLREWFDMTDEEFRSCFRKTPMWRTGRRGILRNAAIILGNQRQVDAVDALSKGLQDFEPLVREAAAWALGRIANRSSLASLRNRAAIETDQAVMQEIKLAIEAVTR